MRTQSKPRSLKERAARAWLKRGAAVIPLIEGGKQPINKGWSKSPLRKWSRLDELFAERPDANYGIVTGKASGLIVLDVDGRQGVETLQALRRKHGPLPRTITVRTGRGHHRYFKDPGKRVGNTAGRLGQGLDVRGEGGYVVGVGSVHESGITYKYAKDRGPKSVKVADAPDWLIELVIGAPLASPPTAGSDAQDRDRGRAYANAALQDELERLRGAPHGQRNDTLNRCAFRLGQLTAHGILDEDRVISDLSRAAGLIGLSEGEIGSTIRSGLNAGRQQSRALPSFDDPVAAGEATLPAAVNDPLTRELSALGETDADNAERFARRFGRQIKYTPGRGFLFFDGSRWKADTLLEGSKLLEETARSIADEAQYLDREADRASRARFANATLAKAALERMRDLAKSRLMVDDRMLDADKWLLNLLNGTLDLRTGKLEAHDPKDLLTKLAPVTFDPAARCPTFKTFIAKALRDEKQLIRYLQKGIGYSLTGDTREQIFFFLKGPGGSGKSVFINAIRDTLGDYGLHTPSETLLAKQYDSGIPSDVARLAGSRMVSAIEVNWNRQIDESRMKAMTGGDPITARFLRHEWFEFLPEFKLWFAANDFPGVRGTAGAFWRRVRVIPFTVEVADKDQDKTLPEKLAAERSGILNWALEGCLRWQREGLGEPDSIKSASDEWKTASDHVQKFVNERLIIMPGSTLSSAELYSQFRAWCKANGEEAPASDRKIKAMLAALDFGTKRVGSGTVWKDLKLRIE